MACSGLERKIPVWLASVAVLAAAMTPAAGSAAAPVRPDFAAGQPAPFSMVFAPATAPGAPAFEPVPIVLPVRDWTPFDVAAQPPTNPRPSDAAPRTINVRQIDPPPAVDTAEGGAGTEPSPSPIDLAGRLFAWFGELFTPAEQARADASAVGESPAAVISNDEPAAVATAPESDVPPGDAADGGWTAASITSRGRSGGRPDDSDFRNDIRFDLIGWLGAADNVAEGDGASDPAATPATGEMAAAAPLPEPDTEPSAAEPAPGIVIARISDDPAGSTIIESPAIEPAVPDVASAPLEPAPATLAEPATAVATVEEPAAIEPETANADTEEDGDGPLVIYIRGTVAFEDMYFGDGDRLGRKLAHAEPAVACAEKNGGGTHVCPETTVWPADVATLFGVAEDELPESIVRYDDRTARQYRAAFPAASYDHLVDKLSGRLGMPTKLSESLAPVVGMPKQTNRVARWVSTEQTEHGKAILEVRSIDDMLWNLPPDLGHGVVRLYFEGAEPIYATVSKADLRLVRIRNMIAPGEEPL